MPATFSASLEYARSLRLVVNQLVTATKAIEPVGEPDEPGQHKLVPSASGMAMNALWDSYRSSRQALDSALRYYLDRSDGNAVNAHHPVTQIRWDVVGIDEALRQPITFKGTPSLSAENLFRPARRASSFVEQARDVEALVPPVIDVDRDFAATVSELRPGACRSSSRLQGSLDTILTGLPWFYQVAAIAAWMLLSWSIAARVVRQSPGPRGIGDDSLFDFRGEAAVARRLYTHLLIVTLVVAISACSAGRCWPSSRPPASLSSCPFSSSHCSSRCRLHQTREAGQHIRARGSGSWSPRRWSWPGRCFAWTPSISGFASSSLRLPSVS